MAHLVQTMAYVGATPWHHLGTQLPTGQLLEAWIREAGIDLDRIAIEGKPCFQI